jgi:hypothetical protein
LLIAYKHDMQGTSPAGSPQASKVCTDAHAAITQHTQTLTLRMYQQSQRMQNSTQPNTANIHLSKFSKQWRNHKFQYS